MANEVKELNLDDILTLIQGQLLEYMNADGNYERFKDLNIVLSKEQQFIKLKDKDPKTMYIVVRFGSAEVTFGQTVLPATIVALAPQNNLDIAQTLFYEYAQKYNLQRAANDTVNQVYESPQILENFSAVYEGYRSVISMTAAFVIGTNSNEYKVYYYISDSNGTEHAEEVPQISASFAYIGNADSQIFYNSNDFTRSVIGFGGVTLGFTAFVLQDNALINDVLSVLGEVDLNAGFTYIVPLDTKISIAESAPESAPESGQEDVMVIDKTTDIGYKWNTTVSEWISEGEIDKIVSGSAFNEKVNKTFKLGVIYRDKKHARVKNYRLTNVTGSQELGQIPLMTLAFVE